MAVESGASWSWSDVWEYIVGDESQGAVHDPDTSRGKPETDRAAAALRKALGVPGRKGEAFTWLQHLTACGVDPLDVLDPSELEQLTLFGARCSVFVEMVRPDFTTGGWTTSCNDEADVVFAYRTAGDHELQALFIKDLPGFDAVQAAVGFSEVDLHAHHVEGLVESAPLVETPDAGLWVQLRETTDEIVQVEMVNLLKEPLGAIMHMYYTQPGSSMLFPDAEIPLPRKPRCSLNYKQSVSFTPLPQGHVRAHFAFIMDMDPRMQLAILRLPAADASNLLRQAFSSWPATFQTFLEKHRAEILRREHTSVHAPFYGVCREHLTKLGLGRMPGAASLQVQASLRTRTQHEEEDAFFDADDGEGGNEVHTHSTVGGGPGGPLGEQHHLPGVDPLGSQRKRAVHPVDPLPSLILGASTKLRWDQRTLWERLMDGQQAPNVAGATPRRPSSVGADLNEYQQQHSQDYEALKALEPLDGWDFRMRHDGVDIYTKDIENLPCKCFKGYTTIRTFGHGPRPLVEALKAHGKRAEWDDLCIASRVVEEYPPFYSVGQFKFSATRLISVREMLVMCHLFFEEDGSIFCTCRSTEMESIPEDPDCVRCTLHNGGYVVRPTEDGDAFLLIYAGCVDSGGWVPTWVQDLVAWRQPFALAKFRTYFEDSLPRCVAASA